MARERLREERPPPLGPPPSTEILATPDAGPAALRGGTLRTLGYGAGILLSVASAPLLIRHLGVVDFGRYVTVISLVTLVGGITEGGVNGVALREYASLEAGARDAAMRNLLGIRIVLTIAGVAGAMGFALAAGYDSPLVVGTLGASGGLFVQVLQSLLAVPLQGGLRFGWVTAAELLRQVLWVTALVALVLAGAGLVPFLFAQIPAAAAALALTIWLVRRLTPLRPGFEPRAWWPLLRDTIPYAVSVAINATYFRIAILILSLVATELETGYFATSFRVVEVLVGVPGIIIGAAFPILARAARHDEERFDRASERILELALILGLWTVLCLELGAQPIIDVLAGDESEPSVGVLRIQGVALFATFLAFAAGYPLLSMRRHRALLVANAVALVVSVSCTLALAPPYGAEGAAVATVAAEVALAASTVAVLLRARPRLAGFLRGVPPILAAAGAGGAVALLPAVPAVADVVLGSAAFLAALVLLRRFPPEVRDALRGRPAQ